MEYTHIRGYFFIFLRVEKERHQNHKQLLQFCIALSLKFDKQLK